MIREIGETTGGAVIALHSSHVALRARAKNGARTAFAGRRRTQLRRAGDGVAPEGFDAGDDAGGGGLGFARLTPSTLDEAHNRSVDGGGRAGGRSVDIVDFDSFHVERACVDRTLVRFFFSFLIAVDGYFFEIRAIFFLPQIASLSP